MLQRAFDYCDANNIPMYRMSSNMFPFADSSIGSEVFLEFIPALGNINTHGIRAVFHPDQFVVLSSDDDNVVANSVAILEHHSAVMDAMGLPASRWAAINIHGGKKQRASRFIDSLQYLSSNVLSRLTIENDEYSYDVLDLIEIYNKAKIPILFDIHHALCFNKLSSYDDKLLQAYFQLARSTWTYPALQLMHISNGQTELLDRKHSDYISIIPDFQKFGPFNSLWLEIEAKAKDKAIYSLREQLKPYV